MGLSPYLLGPYRNMVLLVGNAPSNNVCVLAASGELPARPRDEDAFGFSHANMAGPAKLLGVDGTALPTALVAVHVLANVVWIGAILSVALTLGRAGSTKDPAGVAGLARYLYERLAVPAFVTSFGAGVLRIALAPSFYAHMPWFHAKLTFALVIIALHHVIGARAKRAAAGTPDAAKGVSTLGVVTFAAAALTVFLGVAKSFP
jgi:putative membrane protein